MDREPRTSPEDREGTQGPGDLAATPGPGDLAATFCATLVDEWARRGVTDAVVCPGSRNTAVSLALVGDDRLRTHVVHDERSAAFLALGLSVGSGRPVVLTCTSGSAPTHFHPAVVEADLAAVPLILVTADRPPELQGVLAPQTIDQRDLYGTAVRWYCEPGPPAPGSSPWWRDLARDALARACGSRPGPVQLDLAFREPLVGAVGALPEPEDPVGEPVPWSPTLAPGWNLTDEDVVRLVGALSGRRGVIVAGARAARSDAEREPVLALASELGWPLLADPLSGLRVPHPAVVAAFDPVLRSGVFRSSPPEVVIRLGGLVASRATAEWLRGGAAGAPLTLAVDRYGLCPDPDSTVAREFTCVPGEFAARLSGRGIEPAPQAWTGHWRAAGDAAAEGLREWLGGGDGNGCEEPFTAATLCDSLAAGSELVVASSMPVRDLESYAEPRRGVRVHSNRGTNGIDGSIATATGVALGSGAPTALLCGDLAFLHDVGSLNGLAARGADLTIVVVDNDGGGIFSFLPQAESLSQETFERVFGTPHGHELAPIAGAFGLRCATPSTRSELRGALAAALGRPGVDVIVVDSDRGSNLSVHRQLQELVDRRIGQAPGDAG